MTVAEQIIVLLALTHELFDLIPVASIREAETALCKSNEKLPDDLLKRLMSDKPLSEADIELVLNLARQTLSVYEVKKDETNTQNGKA
jgi:F-type H+-transporting ATPase subunit alpha